MPKQMNEATVYSRYVGFDWKQEFDGDGNILYFGYAYPGAKTSEAKWQIWKGEHDSDNRQTSLRYANKNDEFDKIWDDRTDYDYEDI